ncbi:MAG: nicotinamide riboside transporter PnuC [Massilia sp.]|jgi:nicotinamide mononucleotide transporter
MNDTLVLLGFSTTPLELLGFVLSVATVVLTILRNHWGWFFAIVSSATYGVVFFGARLYGDAGLQGVFIAASIWGWWQWLRGAAGRPLPVTRLSGAGWIAALLGWAVGFFALSAFLKAYTDTDVPHMDGFLTAGSLVGQLLTAKKKVENWHTWIVVDVLYVGLYIYKGLHLTAILYAVFVVLAVLGLRAWTNAASALDMPAAEGAR